MNLGLQVLTGRYLLLFLLNNFSGPCWTNIRVQVFLQVLDHWPPLKKPEAPSIFLCSHCDACLFIWSPKLRVHVGIWVYVCVCMHLPGSEMCERVDHQCQHICVSSPASYRCKCLKGFSLNEDGRTCRGERTLNLLYKYFILLKCWFSNKGAILHF